jgi:hypothetical protein
MIVKNTLSQGYPFVEAIAQALPVCDEILVGDGGSTDGTLEILRRLEQLNPKIRVYVDPWPEKNLAHDLRWATNRLMQKCRGEYILYIQANEVIHEKSWEYLRSTPEIWPVALTFSLPFLLLYGTLRFHEQYRLRMARRLPFIEAIYDAWALGLKKTFILKELLKATINPMYMARILYKGLHRIYADTGGIPKYTVPVIPPKPIYRYQAIYPLDPINKAIGRAKTWGHDTAALEARRREILEKCKDKRRVMEEILEEARRTMRSRGHQVPAYPLSLREEPVEEHPKIIQDMLRDDENCSYYVREELYNMIKETR